MLNDKICKASIVSLVTLTSLTSSIEHGSMDKIQASVHETCLTWVDFFENSQRHKWQRCVAYRRSAAIYYWVCITFLIPWSVKSGNLTPVSPLVIYSVMYGGRNGYLATGISEYPLECPKRTYSFDSWMSPVDRQRTSLKLIARVCTCKASLWLLSSKLA